MEKVKMNVLGTDYTIQIFDTKEAKEHKAFETVKGYFDYTTKTINVIGSDTDDLAPEDIPVGDPAVITQYAIRHELIHAFLEESGLKDEITVPEELIDWIALQLPKIMKVCLRHGLLSEKDLEDCVKAYEDHIIKDREGVDFV